MTESQRHSVETLIAEIKRRAVGLTFTKHIFVQAPEEFASFDLAVALADAIERERQQPAEEGWWRGFLGRFYDLSCAEPTYAELLDQAQARANRDPAIDYAAAHRDKIVEYGWRTIQQFQHMKADV